MLLARQDVIHILPDGDELHWSEEILFHICNTEILEGIFLAKMTGVVLKLQAGSMSSELVVC